MRSANVTKLSEISFISARLFAFVSYKKPPTKPNLYAFYCFNNITNVNNRVKKKMLYPFVLHWLEVLLAETHKL